MKIQNKMNKKGYVIQILMIILIVFLLGVVTMTIYINSFTDISCLEETAKELCEERGYEYYDTFWSFEWNFYCKEDMRINTHKTFLFLDSEVEECK